MGSALFCRRKNEILFVETQEIYMDTETSWIIIHKYIPETRTWHHTTPVYLPKKNDYYTVCVTDSQEEIFFMFPAKAGGKIGVMNIFDRTVYFYDTKWTTLFDVVDVRLVSCEKTDQLAVSGFVRNEYKGSEIFPKYLEDIIALFGRTETIFVCGLHDDIYSYAYVNIDVILCDLSKNLIIYPCTRY